MGNHGLGLNLTGEVEGENEELFSLPWGSELARLVVNTDTAEEVSGRQMGRVPLLTK